MLYSNYSAFEGVRGWVEGGPERGDERIRIRAWRSLGISLMGMTGLRGGGKSTLQGQLVNLGFLFVGRHDGGWVSGSLVVERDG